MDAQSEPVSKWARFSHTNDELDPESEGECDIDGRPVININNMDAEQLETLQSQIRTQHVSSSYKTRP